MHVQLYRGAEALEVLFGFNGRADSQSYTPIIAVAPKASTIDEKTFVEAFKEAFSKGEGVPLVKRAIYKAAVATRLPTEVGKVAHCACTVKRNESSVPHRNVSDEEAENIFTNVLEGVNLGEMQKLFCIIIPEKILYISGIEGKAVNPSYEIAILPL